MAAYKDLKELMKIVIKWESDLKDFYDVGEIALKNEKSKEILTLLKEKHIENLNIIKDTKIEDFGKDEWIKFSPDYRIRDLIPIGKIKRKSTPREILIHILEYEEKIRDFYLSISQKIITRGEKDLFESFVKFKEMQITEIKKNLDYF